VISLISFIDLLFFFEIVYNFQRQRDKITTTYSALTYSARVGKNFSPLVMYALVFYQLELDVNVVCGQVTRKRQGKWAKLRWCLGQRI